ncbi:TetR/AcrR family transcriptional regulator [Nocardia sp. BMG111209]|uniref:TetR/AcrR family transcriptional regulator n=1 Tax=Nocardia sp. BMG111209 TaxID=1160137 RepID=UPI000382E627|nr:TetR/AcrR family transcriptional regulator [Nocardia sp. BMG111209]
MERIPLSRERVLGEAIAIADESGIEGLTMRSLATRLGAKPMSLYHHVANKEAIIDGIIDVVFAEIELPPEDTDWRTALRQRAHSARAVLRRHPWATPFMESRSHPGPATLRHHDAVLKTLRRNGFPLALAGHAYSLLDCYIYGFALEEAALPFTPRTLDDAMTGFMDQFRPDEYPYLVEFAMQHVMRPGYDYADEFDFGLELILDGLARAAQRAE